VTFLSGDVHHSYVAQAWPDPALGVTLEGVVVPATCSPIRNPLPGVMKAAVKLAAKGRARPTGRLLGGKVPRSPLRWSSRRSACTSGGREEWQEVTSTAPVSSVSPRSTYPCLLPRPRWSPPP